MSTLEDRERDRQKLEEETRKYLAKGGKIREIEFGASNDVIDYWGETHRNDGDSDEIVR